MAITTPPNPPRSLDELHRDLTEKLGELHRRATHARVVLSPSTYWRSPALRVGLGVVAGLVVGSRLPRMTRAGVLRALAFAALGAIASRAFKARA
jgi:hypothetical protein